MRMFRIHLQFPRRNGIVSQGASKFSLNSPSRDRKYSSRSALEQNKGDWDWRGFLFTTSGAVQFIFIAALLWLSRTRPTIKQLQHILLWFQSRCVIHQNYVKNSFLLYGCSESTEGLVSRLPHGAACGIDPHIMNTG